MSDNYQIHSDVVEKRSRVVFVANPPVKEWDEIESILRNMVEEGYVDWTFDLEAVEIFSSVGLGKLILVDQIVKNHSGDLVLKVRRDSSLAWQLVEKNLHETVTVSFT